jgi:macrolide transport system ATP-binding/permease protein
MDSLTMHLVGRLKPGVDRVTAQADLDTIGRELRAAAGQGGERGRAVTVYAGTILHPEIAPPVAVFTGILMAAVALVLLIVCVNVAALVLARAAGRSTELAIRQSLGAARGRLIRQLLTENLLLSSAGAFLGLAVAFWFTRLAPSMRLPAPVPIALDLPVDIRVLAFTAIVAIAATLAFGIVPALAVSRVDLVSALKGTQDGRRHGWLRSAFLVAQVSMSVLLLITAGLFIQDFRNAQSLELGFEAAHVQTASIDLETRGYTEARGRELVRELVERLEAAPGVVSASVLDIVPITLLNRVGIVLRDGDAEPVPGQEPVVPMVYMNTVGPGHFKALEIAIVAGRDFTYRDDRASTPVAIVNETLARRFWPGQDAVGQHLHLRPMGGGLNATMDVVGVARDSKYVSVNEEPRPFMYRPFAQDYTPLVTLLVRAAGLPASTLPTITGVVRGLDPDLAVFNASSLTDATAVSLLPWRIAGDLLGALGLLALVLAALGIYGVLSFVVQSRTREIGVRVAIGATPQSVARMVVRQAMTWTAAGMALGLVLAIGVTRFLAAFLFGISPTDLRVFAGVILLLSLVAFTAALVPALRASRLDPIAALRNN